MNACSGIQERSDGYRSHKQGETGWDHTRGENGMRRGPRAGHLGTLRLKGWSEEKPEKWDCTEVSRDAGRKSGYCDAAIPKEETV